MPDTRRRALITGISGQDGSYLAEFLIKKGYDVFGLVRRASEPNTSRIDHLLDESAQVGPGSIQLLLGDLSESSSLMTALQVSQADEVYNLAAQSHVQVSFEVPDYTGNITGLGALRLLEAMRQLGSSARFYQASSSELFGKVRETPQRETTPFHPRSPYAAAKAYAFHVTRTYREAYNLFACNGILFNHESPRRGETFVTRKITRAVAEMALGRTAPLRLGNLNARRDWGHARDYVEAMWLMLQIDKPDDFVIATGQCQSVREFCELAFQSVGNSIRWEGEGLEERGLGSHGETLVEIDPQFFRPAEVDLLLGDATKARTVLGWAPQTSFEELVAEMVEADLKALDRGSQAGPPTQLRIAA